MPGKKIIVACDGTWTNSDNGFKRTSSWFSSDVEGILAIPSNVTRFCRALKSTAADGRPQLTYYQAGLGSANNWYSFYVGGYLGEGLSENIREAYAFICNNYEEGDEIYLVGFSRGAFTARSIAGLIEAIGLLTKKGLVDFYTVFRDWEHQSDPDYFKPGSKGWITAINIPEPRPNYGKDKQAYVDQLVKNSLTRPAISVEAVAVWDTVGSLGLPSFVVPPFSWFQNKDAPKAYAFINTEIPRNLRFAYQALALDERRTPFSPTVWELPADINKTQLQELKQCWFAGAHSNVGGSYPDTGIADITLAWILQQLSRSLTFDPKYLASQAKENMSWLAKNDPDTPRPWSCGKVYDSGNKVQNFLVGANNRTPGNYTRADPSTGKSTNIPLRKTHEFIHPSVRVRRVLGGYGTGDTPKYKPPYNNPWPLKDWTLVEPKGCFAAKTNLKNYSETDLWETEYEDRWKWVKQAENGKITWIAEEKMDGVEWDLVTELDLLTKGSTVYDAIIAS